MEIRILTERDADALWNLRLQALETDPWSFEQSPDELRKLSPVEYFQQLQLNRAESFVAGAVEQQAAFGMVGLYQELPRKRRHKGWIWGVYVAPAVRGQGVARSLLQMAIEHSKKISEIEILQLAVSVKQPAPRHLYESLGFRPIGIEPAGLKIADERLDEEHMFLELCR